MLPPTQSAWQESSALRRLSGDPIPIQSQKINRCGECADNAALPRTNESGAAMAAPLELHTRSSRQSFANSDSTYSQFTRFSTNALR